MSASHRLFGAELSPYSVKVRSYFRYKQIPHEWIPRSLAHMEEFKRYARLPLIPLVVTPEGEGLQDSTPIIEHFEALHPEPSIHPPDATLAFLSALIEDYADEWGNKPMFHFRWWREVDRESGAERIARTMLGDAPEEEVRRAIPGVKERMVPRLAFVGSSDATQEQIEASFDRQVELLEAHLASRSYLFGERPAFGDFGLWAQLYQCAGDPTPGERIRRQAPRVLQWIQRMLDPKAEGDFEDWEKLGPTLEPLLEREVAGLYLPWSTANARALEAGEEQFEVELEGRPFRQNVQKYHARSLRALRERYAAVGDKSALDPILERTGCLSWLRD